VSPGGPDAALGLDSGSAGSPVVRAIREALPDERVSRRYGSSAAGRARPKRSFATRAGVRAFPRRGVKGVVAQYRERRRARRMRVEFDLPVLGWSSPAPRRRSKPCRASRMRGSSSRKLVLGTLDDRVGRIPAIGPDDAEGRADHGGAAFGAARRRGGSGSAAPRPGAGVALVAGARVFLLGCTHYPPLARPRRRRALAQSEVFVVTARGDRRATRPMDRRCSRRACAGAFGRGRRAGAARDRSAGELRRVQAAFSERALRT
jgi:hypothetical protein